MAQRLAVVGEAAGRISVEVKERYVSVPWVDIVALRNIPVHKYFGIDWQLVWKTATYDAPRLRVDIAKILRAEFPI